LGGGPAKKAFKKQIWRGQRGPEKKRGLPEEAPPVCSKSPNSKIQVPLLPEMKTHEAPLPGKNRQKDPIWGKKNDLKKAFWKKSKKGGFGKGGGPPATPLAGGVFFVAGGKKPTAKGGLGCGFVGGTWGRGENFAAKKEP